MESTSHRGKDVASTYVLCPRRENQGVFNFGEWKEREGAEIKNNSVAEFRVKGVMEFSEGGLYSRHGCFSR